MPKLKGAGPARPDGRVSLTRLGAFAAPGLPVGALAIGLSVFLPPYYAGHFGLGLGMVGAAFGIVRLVDMMFDPFIGVMMDRTRTRIGRYRPWLLAGAALMMLAVFMLFETPFKPSLAYLTGWLFVYYLAASLLVLAHLSWASGIAVSYAERARVFGAIQVVSVLGSAGVLVLPVAIGHLAGTRGDAVPAMGWFILAVAPLGALLAALVTPEPLGEPQPHEKASWREYWRMISRPDMARIIVADFCLMMGPGWMSALYLFYFRAARGFTTSQASIFLIIYIFSGILGAGLISRLAMRFGKHRTQQVTCVLYSIGLGSLHFLPSTLPAICGFMVLLGLVSQGFILLDRAMVADVGDAVRLEQGKHRVGLLYGMITTVQKIALGLSITVSFPILKAVGFDPVEGALNTPEAIHGLKMVYIIGPTSFVMLGALCYVGYSLDDKAHSKIREALALRDAQATAALSEIDVFAAQ